MSPRVGKIWIWKKLKPVCDVSSSMAHKQYTFDSNLTLWSRSSSKCYLRIQSVPQREHHTSPLQRSTG
jgi:hypothetical protein